MLFFINTANASTASVYSISSTSAPIIDLDSYRVKTITKGIYDGKNKYKAMYQAIPKTLFISTFRTAVKVSPFAVGALLAFDLLLDEYGDIVDPNSGEIIGFPDTTSGYYYASWGCCSSSSGTKTYSALVTTFGDPYNFVDLGDGRYTWRANINNNIHKITFTPNKAPNTESSYISDDDLYDLFLNAQTLDSDVFLNADGSVNQDYFPNPTFDYITADDAVLMDLYGSGLLQSTDPTADNYITPSELARIKALYDEANMTDEELAEQLTADLEQPITQAQYAEEQASKEARAVTDATDLDTIDLTGLDKTTELDNQFDILDNLILNPADLPSALPALPQFSYSSGCQIITMPFSNVTFPNSSQCAMLNDGKTMIGYFLYVVFAWMISVQLLKEAN